MTTIKETSTSGEFGDHKLIHGLEGSSWRPIKVNAAGELVIDAAAGLIDKLWDRLLAGHTDVGSAGKKLSDIPTTAMRGTDAALLAVDYEVERGTDNALLAADYEVERGTDNALLAVDYEVERGTNNAYLATDGAGLPNDANIGDLPWDEPLMDHQGAATTGWFLNTIYANVINVVKKTVSPHYYTKPDEAPAITVTSHGSVTHSYGSYVMAVDTNEIGTTFWIVGLMITYGGIVDPIVQIGLGTGSAGSEVDIGNMIACQTDVHQTRNEFVRAGVLVVVNALNQRRGAIADSYDGYIHFAHDLSLLLVYGAKKNICCLSWVR